MADLVEQTVQGIRARMSELAPAVIEYERLQAAYAALGADARDRPSERARGARGRTASRPRAPRGQNKAAVFGVIADRPGVTVTELAQVTGIAKPLIYNTTRAGVERGELERVALPGGQQGFKVRAEEPAGGALGVTPSVPDPQ